MLILALVIAGVVFEGLCLVGLYSIGGRHLVENGIFFSCEAVLSGFVLWRSALWADTMKSWRQHLAVGLCMIAAFFTILSVVALTLPFILFD